MDLRFAALVLVSFSSFAQVIPEHRKVDWSLAGNTEYLQTPTELINILDFGGLNDLSGPNDAAIQSAINQLLEGYGAIYFPEGEYLFNQTIELADSTWLVGESSNSVLKFNVPDGNAIQMAGQQSLDTLWIAQSAHKGALTLSVNDIAPIAPGELLRIGMNDTDLVVSDWAQGFYGQIVRVVDTIGTQIFLEDPLNLGLDLERAPFAVRIVPRTHAGVQCLTVERLDTVNNHNINISIQRAHNCVVRNVSGIVTDFAHTAVSASAHCEVSGSYFKDAIAYGGGGQGYGVVVQYASSFNLVENNTFEHLRHSMMVQAGSGGNVFGYNYSLDSYWVESNLPNNAAGDIVLHGNYPYLNLFEGNVASNIVVDASHDINGPFNTLFRNRAELYGVIMDDQTPSDSLNWIGNEVTMSGFPFGNFALFGDGHLVQGNNVGGSTTPPGSAMLADTSLYLSEPLETFNGDWPLIGYPAALAENDLPAQDRYVLGEFTECTEPLITNTRAVMTEHQMWVDKRGYVRYKGAIKPGTVTFYDRIGRVILRENWVEGLRVPESTTRLLLVTLQFENGTTLSGKYIQPH